MKRFRSSLIFSSILGVLSMPGELDSQILSHFEINGAPASIHPGEEFDVSIKAIGIEGQLETSWQGEVKVSFWVTRENPVIS